jgi:hypothetical protein
MRQEARPWRFILENSNMRSPARQDNAAFLQLRPRAGGLPA